MTIAARRFVPAVILPVLLLASTGCDIVTADFKQSATEEWRKTYEIQPGGRVEIVNVNGTIEVEGSSGNTVEVFAKKTAKGASDEAAKQALQRVRIVEDVGPSSVRVETRVERGGGWFNSGANVTYTVRVPAGTQMKFSTVNGGVELRNISGQITAETTNGGIKAREVAGSIDASTTNGGIEVDLTELGERGADIACTNGGIKLRLPAHTKASITASVANGGIDTVGLELDTTSSSRRRLDARLNGGGPPIRIEGVNGGIQISAR
jgi:DUF4097 and DUF4098 domain-containing protein YvlB